MDFSEFLNLRTRGLRTSKVKSSGGYSGSLSLLPPTLGRSSGTLVRRVVSVVETDYLNVSS